MKTPLLIGTFAILLGLGGCGGDDSPAIDAHPTIDSAQTADAAADAATGTFALTVKNYLSWCDVTVNGGAPVGTAQQVVNVAPGAIAVSAVAHVGFQIGTAPWHDTDGDTTGNGEQGTVTGTGQTASSATTETITNAPSCIWVCCEFSGGGGCDVADQCP